MRIPKRNPFFNVLLAKYISTIKAHDVIVSTLLEDF